jgi:hypothetical protein
MIPSKVKKIIWRALHGILPLRSILANRHIGSEGGCPICNNAAEDVMHLCFKCPTTIQLWESLGISSLMDEVIVEDRSGSAVLETIFRKQEVILPGFNIGLKEAIAVGCWYLWWIRRKRTHNELVPPMFKCRTSILTIASNAAKIFAKPGTPRQRWIKPPPRTTKVNTFHLLQWPRLWRR